MGVIEQMKQLQSRRLQKLGGVGLVAIAAACGSVNDGDIIVIDDPTATSGSGGTGSGGKGAGGGAGGDGTGAGTNTGGSSGSVSGAAPTVTAITPEDMATAVEPKAPIEITFSEGLDPATVSAETVTVLDGTTPVAGTVTYVDNKAVFTPATRLDLLATYTVKVTTGVKDTENTPMEADYTATFTVRDGAWKPQEQLANPVGLFPSYNAYPRPVFDAQGNGLIVWAQSKAADSYDYSIWARFYTPGAGWQPAVEVDQVDSSCSEPAVAMGANGDAVVAWSQQNATYPQMFARRYIARAWETTAQRIDLGDETYPSSVKAAVAPDGEFHVMWTGSSSSSYLYGHHNHASGSDPWAPKYNSTNFAAAAGGLTSPALAFDASGNGFAVLANYSYNSTAMNYSSEVTSYRYLVTGQQFTYGATIPGSQVTRPGPTSATALALDATGGAVALWNEGTDLKFSRYTKVKGWSTAAAIEDLTGYLAYGERAGPFVHWDGTGFVACWIQAPSEGSSVQNVYSSRYDGTAWGAVQLVSDGDRNVYWDSGFGFGVDRHGNALATWMHGTNSSDVVDILSNRFNASTMSWSAAGSSVNSLEGQNNQITLAVADNGTAIALWAGGNYYNISGLYTAVFE
jgi:hypothetical protein